MQIDGMPGKYPLEHHGLHNLGRVYWNLKPSALIEKVIQKQEAILSSSGAIVVRTGKFTGRSPDDKFIVKNHAADHVWWGKVNQPFQPEKFDLVLHKIRAYLQGRDVFVQDLQAGAHSDFGFPIRLITEKAWAALFAHNLFIRLPQDKIIQHIPELTIFHCPDFQVHPSFDSTRSNILIALDFEKKILIIAGTSYAGEIKKAVFTALNYFYPPMGILPMHCSANQGSDGDVALFFGLSGTGKTTLSSDPDRYLIGDDEHAWYRDGIFNLEGGCYAKTIHLREELEPLIWSATHRFGAVLENVTCDPISRELDFDDDHLTENTRGAYPITFIPNHVPGGIGNHPGHIFFLTADAFGILPPIARLSQEQAMYYFLSGYTSKLAGTETGLGAEPQATFSACFGAPFLPLSPTVYANLLGEKTRERSVKVWLVNTGWTGGAYGVGQRISIRYTRAMIKAALNGSLDHEEYRKEPYFGLEIPLHCDGVPTDILDPRQTWSNPEDYHNQAQLLLSRFEKNFSQYVGLVSEEVWKAGPHQEIMPGRAPA